MNKRAFTLLELLVAFVVFLVLVMMVTQLVTETSRQTLQESRKMELLADTRQALDRFALDWATRLQRPDVDWTLLKAPGNDAVMLLCQATAYSGDRRVASVAYRVNPATRVLERGTLGYHWKDHSTGQADPLPTLEFGVNGVAPLPPASSDYEELSPTVFRLCLTFLDADTGQWSSTPPGALNGGRLKAVVLSVAALDEQSRQMITPAQLEQLATYLSDPSGSENPVTLWTQRLEAPNFPASLGLPAAVGSAVRLYQRIYYVES